jgi:hypothetical protein
MLYQRALRLRDVGRRDTGGQYVDRLAHGADLVLADRTCFYRGRQLRQLRLHRGTGQRAPRPDPGRELKAADDFPGRDAQPHPEHLSYRWYALAAVGWVGDLGEEPVHEPAVGAILCLQPLSDVNAEIVANHVGPGVAQHRVRSVDSVESSTDPLPCLLATRARTHIPTL